MNKYQIDGPNGGEEIIAAKMLITNSGVAIFKNFQGETFMAFKEWDSVVLLETGLSVPDDENEDD